MDADVREHFELTWRHFDGIAAELRTEMGDLRSEMGGLRTEVGGLRTEVGDLRTEVGDLRTEVGDLRTEVGDLRTEVGGLRTEVGGLRTEVGGLRTGMDGLRSEMGGMQTDLRSEIAAVRDESRFYYLENRRHTDEVAADLRAEIRDTATELRQHFDVSVEKFRSDLQTVAEGYIYLDNRMTREFSELRTEMREMNAETQALIRAALYSRGA